MAGRKIIKDKHPLFAKFASCVVIERGGKILLKRRCGTDWMPGFYACAAGHPEQDETYTQAAVRELYEETNLKTKEKFLKVAHIVDVAATKSKYRYLYIYFRCIKWTGKVKNREPNKCDDLSWFNKKHLPKKISPVTRQALKNIEKGIYYSTWGWKKINNV